MDIDLSTGSSNTPTNFVPMGTTLFFTAPGGQDVVMVMRWIRPRMPDSSASRGGYHR